MGTNRSSSLVNKPVFVSYCSMTSLSCWNMNIALLVTLHREMFLLFGFVGVSYAMLWIVPPAFVQW